MGVPGSAHAALSFGALTIGFVKKGSKRCRLRRKSPRRERDYDLGRKAVRRTLLAAGTSGAMALALGSRFMKTGKVMPAGLISAVSVVSLAYHTKKALEWKD